MKINQNSAYKTYSKIYPQYNHSISANNNFKSTRLIKQAKKITKQQDKYIVRNEKKYRMVNSIDKEKKEGKKERKIKEGK